MKKQIKKSRKPRPTATERYVVIAATLPEGDDEGNDILVCDGYDVATSDEDGVYSLTLQQARRLASYYSADAKANPTLYQKLRQRLGKFDFYFVPILDVATDFPEETFIEALRIRYLGEGAINITTRTETASLGSELLERLAAAG